MSSVLIPDHDRRGGLTTASDGPPLIAAHTAQWIAARLIHGFGPALRQFAVTGRVSAKLYPELARLYDLRRPEVEQLLDALTRYAMQQRQRTEGRR